jgi:arginase family enzyme
MDLSVFLSPSLFHDSSNRTFANNTLGAQTRFYFDDENDLNDRQLAIVGVCEDRNSDNNVGSANAPDDIRRELYMLLACDDYSKIIDLGNILPGETPEDTYYALSEVCAACMKLNVIPIVLGGSQDLTFGTYKAYEGMEQTVNLVTIDSKLDFGSSPDDSSADGYLNRIILHRPNYLFNYSNLGHQRYLTDKALLDLTSKMYFDAIRLGEIQQDLSIAEPVLRNADLISFDLSAIRYSEFMSSNKSSPNGFFGHEAAQLCKYAGMSEKLTCIGFYEFNASMEDNGQSSKLTAQLIWCFIDGFHARRGDYPIASLGEYEKFIVLLTDSGDELVFYKSHLTNRWWLEVAYPAGIEEKYERNHVVPCTYSDYLAASQQEMPDRWWKTFQKLV